MPSPTSHALQALDRSIFGALKKLVRKILARYYIEHQRLGKWEISNLFQQAGQDAASTACESNAASGFATTGVFPPGQMLVLALQQKESKLAELDQLSTRYMCKPESVCWSYKLPVCC